MRNVFEIPESFFPCLLLLFSQVGPPKVEYLVEVLIHCRVDSSPSKQSGPKWAVSKLPKPCGVGDKGSAQVSRSGQHVTIARACIWFDDCISF